jgi:hypothetical protein
LLFFSLFLFLSFASFWMTAMQMDVAFAMHSAVRSGAVSFVRPKAHSVCSKPKQNCDHC